jgi:hypothetical protein
MTPSAAIFVGLVIFAFAAFMVTLGAVAIYVREPTPRRVPATRSHTSIQAKRVSA